MIGNINFNSNQNIYLETNIRTTANSDFSSFKPIENKHEDSVFNITSKQQEEKENKIHFSNLGAPAGFFLDTSLLSQEDKNDIQCCQF